MELPLAEPIEALVAGEAVFVGEPVDCDFIDTVAGVDAAVAALRGAEAIAVDLEGIDLGQAGRIATLQLCGEDRDRVYIIDVATLGADAFTPGLRELLEAPESPFKLFFDCRCDTASLSYQYGVSVPPAKIVDLQLLDVAAASAQMRALRQLGGLGWLFDRTRHAGLAPAERERMAQVKDAARRTFAPELGGSYEAWLVRPLSPVLLEYATDVRFFHALWRSLAAAAQGQLPAVRAALEESTVRRCAEALEPGFDSGDRAARVAIDPLLLEDLAAVWGPPAAAPGGGDYYRGGGGGRGRGYHPRGFVGGGGRGGGPPPAY